MKCKKILAVILAALMTTSSMGFTAFAEDNAVNTEQSQNVAEEQTTIEISTAADFKGFLDGINESYAYKDKIVVLKNNIDFGSAALSAGSGNFAGTFNGQNYTIKNFTLTKPLLSGQITKDGVVKDITLENVTLNNTAENARLGLVCRNINGKVDNVNIKNCKITSTVKTGAIGAIAAMTQVGCTLENSSVDGFTFESENGALAVGGVCGLLIGDETTTVSDITAENVTIDASASVGGLWGYDNESVGSVTNCSDNTGIIIVATNGGYRYSTLQAAYDNADNASTITLTKDIQLKKDDIEANDRLVKAYRKDLETITFDLGGHTLSLAEDVKDTSCTDFRFFNIWYSDVTIKNGTIDLTNDEKGFISAICVFNDGNNSYLHLDINAVMNPCDQLVFSNGKAVEFNGGTYTCTDNTYDNYPYVGIGFYKTILNTSAGCPFTFNGGTFVNFDPLCQCKLAHYTVSGLGEGKAMKKEGGTFTIIDTEDVVATITRTVTCWKDWGDNGTKERTYSYTSLDDAIENAEDGEYVQFGDKSIKAGKRSIEISADKTEVEMGDIVEINVTLKGTDIANAVYNLEYDIAKFELISADTETVPNSGKFYEMLYKEDGTCYKNDDVLATYTFKALGQTENVTADFVISNTSASTYLESIDGIKIKTTNNEKVTVAINLKEYEVEVSVDGDTKTDETLTVPYTNEGHTFNVTAKPEATVSYKVNGTASDSVSVSERGTYTIEYTITPETGYAEITGAFTLIIGDPEYVVEVNLDSNAENRDYVAGKKVVLVYTNTDGLAFNYGSDLMIDVTERGYKYNGTAEYSHVYAFVTDAIESDNAEVTVKDYKANISCVIPSPEELIKLEYSMDLNFDNSLTVQDITVAYGVYTANEDYFKNIKYQKNILRTDINGDKVVNNDDTNAVVNAVKRNEA